MIATRSLDKQVPGITELVAKNEIRVRSGITAYATLEKLRAGDKSEATKSLFDQHKRISAMAFF